MSLCSAGHNVLNWLHSRIFRPEDGWDPVPEGYVCEYAGASWRAGADESVLNLVEKWIGNLRGKSVLDLGGGPGHYSIAFAKRGALVTWHDVSARYRRLAMDKAAQAGVEIYFSLGYMDEAPKLLAKQFDVVFNRVCWNYGWGDASFARVLYSLVKPGGVGYIDTTHSAFKYDSLPMNARLRVWVNNLTWWKIGHTFPPRGRIARMILRGPVEQILVDYSGPFSDRVLFRKSATQDPST
jgi:2-polyprenyl-3-methyl-5-hydroxy-6-metoxy-1,4-benzoquinol methylase